MPAHPATSVVASTAANATSGFKRNLFCHGYRLPLQGGRLGAELSQPPRELVWYLPSLALETHPQPAPSQAPRPGPITGEAECLHASTWHPLTRASTGPTSQGSLTPASRSFMEPANSARVDGRTRAPSSTSLRDTSSSLSAATTAPFRGVEHRRRCFDTREHASRRYPVERLGADVQKARHRLAVKCDRDSTPAAP